jgi:hypothetical protein
MRRHPSRYLAACLFTACVLTSSHAATYYVSSQGTSQGNGSKESPFPDIQTALNKGGGGNTFLVLPGQYEGFNTYLRGGTASSPTIIKSEEKWKAVIRATGDYGIQTLEKDDYVVIDGFEVFGARQNGVYLAGAYNTVRNCWVHNNGTQGIGAYGMTGTTIEDSLVEYNGQHPQFHHGLYVYGDRLTIRNNVVRHNAGYGMHLYPEVTNSTVVNNLVSGQAKKAGILLYSPKSSIEPNLVGTASWMHEQRRRHVSRSSVVGAALDSGRNLVANNTVVDNAIGIDASNADSVVWANNLVVFNTTATQIVTNPAATDAVYSANWTSGDPKFVDRPKEVYWLKAASPVIGKADAAYAPTTDFWGREVTAAPTPGAFVYDDWLATPDARASWLYGWPFRYQSDAGRDQPDLWTPFPQGN